MTKAASASNPALEASVKRRSSKDEADATSRNNDMCKQLGLICLTRLDTTR